MNQERPHRALLVDDEQLALDRMARLLAPHRHRVEWVGMATSVAEAETSFRRLEPDIIFLDIQLPDGTGFDLLTQLDRVPVVIFSTAYDEYALKAFDAHAIDYLLKPVEPERLARALDKIDQTLGTPPRDLRQQMANFLTQWTPQPQPKFKVKHGDRVKFLDYHEIYCFRALDKYVEVWTKDKRYLINQSLSELEQLLRPNGFVRTHRSMLVNGSYIDEIGKAVNGAYFIRLKGLPEHHIPLSRNARKKLDLE